MQQPQAHTPAVDGDTLIRRHLPLVRRVARRHAGRLPTGVELDDLVSWGTFGLLAAVARYQPARDALFPAYARSRIRGAILDQLRRHDWTPRSVREKATAVARAAREAERRFGRPPTEAELAATLGLPPAAYRALLDEVAPVALVGLDELGSDERDDWRAVGEDHEPLGVLLARERAGLVAAAIRRLPEREQLLLSLYYRDELTMKEVGAVLGVTESRVSQLHTQALLVVRALLEQPAPAGGARQRVGRLKVRARTTDETIGEPWERRPGNETSGARRSADGDSRESSSAWEAGATSSMRMRPRGRCSRRSAAALARTEPTGRSNGPPHYAGIEPAGG